MDGRGIGFTLILLLELLLMLGRAFKTVGAYHGLFWYLVFGIWYLVWCGVCIED